MPDVTAPISPLELLNEHDDRIEALEAKVKVLEAQVASLQRSAPRGFEWRALTAAELAAGPPSADPKTDRIVRPADLSARLVDDTFPPVINTEVMEKLPETKMVCCRICHAVAAFEGAGPYMPRCEGGGAHDWGPAS